MLSTCKISKIKSEEHEDDIMDAYLPNKTEEVSELVSRYIVRQSLRRMSVKGVKIF